MTLLAELVDVRGNGFEDFLNNVWNVLVAQMARAFLEVNTLRDEGLRRRRFAIKCDEIKDQHLPALMEGIYEIQSE